MAQDDRPHVLGAAGGRLGLTLVTVVTSRLDLGPFNVVLALAIASLKAALEALRSQAAAQQGTPP